MFTVEFDTRSFPNMVTEFKKDLRDSLEESVKLSARDMHADVMAGLEIAGIIAPLYHGKLAMQNVTGDARRLYRTDFKKKIIRSRVGLLTKADRRRAQQLFWFFYGTINQPARPISARAHDVELRRFYARNRRNVERIGRKHSS